MSDSKKTRLIGYQYDALDRLVGINQKDAALCRRFYRESRLATEFQGQEQLSIVRHGDQILAQQQHQNGGSDFMLLATNLQCSILNTLQPWSQKCVAYSPYGHRPYGIGLSSILGFNGQRIEPVTGHYLLGNGYRAFIPALMRFNSPDKLSPFGKGGLNSYTYCLGDPINYGDASGRIAGMFTKAAQEMSELLGYKVKPIQNLKNLSIGIGAFEDVYKGGSRITFMGHGAGLPGEHLLAAGNGYFLDAGGLIALAKVNQINIENHNSVRLLICHSAELGATTAGKEIPSFGQQLSNISGVPVKAFYGEVGGKATRVSLEGAVVSSNIDYFGVFKEAKQVKKFGGKDPYRPVKFLPQQMSASNSNIRAK